MRGILAQIVVVLNTLANAVGRPLLSFVATVPFSWVLRPGVDAAAGPT